MAAAGVPTAGHAVLRGRDEALERAGAHVVPDGAQGRRPGGRQGRDHLRDRGPRRARRSSRSSSSGASVRPRSCSRSTWRARSSRCWRCATARTSCRSRRRRTTSGSSTATRGRTPAGWAATRRSRASTATRVEEIADLVHRPDRRPDGRARDPVPRRPLRRPDDDRGRAQGARVQLAASAIPRRRPSCRGCAPTWPSSAWQAASPAASPAPTRRFAEDWAVTVVLASARLSRRRRRRVT